MGLNSMMRCCFKKKYHHNGTYKRKKAPKVEGKSRVFIYFANSVKQDQD